MLSALPLGVLGLLQEKRNRELVVVPVAWCLISIYGVTHIISITPPQLLHHKGRMKDWDVPLKPAATPKIYYPGAVVISSGVYLVQHSLHHDPDAETYIAPGFFLPRCNILGCHVHYKFVRSSACKTHIIQTQR